MTSTDLWPQIGHVRVAVKSAAELFLPTSTPGSVSRKRSVIAPGPTENQELGRFVTDAKSLRDCRGNRTVSVHAHNVGRRGVRVPQHVRQFVVCLRAEAARAQAGRVDHRRAASGRRYPRRRAPSIQFPVALIRSMMQRRHRCNELAASAVHRARQLSVMED